MQQVIHNDGGDKLSNNIGKVDIPESSHREIAKKGEGMVVDEKQLTQVEADGLLAKMLQV